MDIMPMGLAPWTRRSFILFASFLGGLFIVTGGLEFTSPPTVIEEDMVLIGRVSGIVIMLLGLLAFIYTKKDMTKLKILAKLMAIFALLGILGGGLLFMGNLVSLGCAWVIYKYKTNDYLFQFLYKGVPK